VGRSIDPIGGRRLAGGIGPILDSLLDLAGNPLRLVLRRGWVSKVHSALGMNPSRRVDGMMADRAAFPTGFEVGRVVVAVRGIHRDPPDRVVCSHDRWTRSGEGIVPNRES
jgi:hypothetical protein